MWAKLDDQFPDHPKVRQLGLFGIAIQTAAICYCARYLTDGYISRTAADSIVASVLAPITLADGNIWKPGLTSGHAGRDATELHWPSMMMGAGLWDLAEHGYQVHDYLEYNPSRERVLRGRAFEANRKKGRRPTRRPTRNTTGNPTRNTAGTTSGTPGGNPWPPSPSPSPSPVPVPEKERSSPPTSPHAESTDRPDDLSITRTEGPESIAAIMARRAELRRERGYETGGNTLGNG